MPDPSPRTTAGRVARLEVTTFAQRPELVPRVYDFRDTWPEFMSHDPTANALFWQVVKAFPQLCIAVTADDVLVARGRAIPVALNAPGRGGVLPATGWDRVMTWGMDDRLDGAVTDTVSALEIAIDAAYLGIGLSARILGAMRDAAVRAGYTELVAPVRPNEKHRYPLESCQEYLQRVRPDGLPQDPWLRTHVRAGGVVDSVAPASMVIPGSLEQWRRWTGLPFETDGPTLVPQALVPVHVDLRHGHAVYVEPNVWVRHRLG